MLNGPSSSGKSSVMAALVADAPTPWVAFDELAFGEVRMEYRIWRDSAPTLPVGFLAGITALAAAGNQVILSAGGRSSDHFAPLRATVPTLDVGLHCPLEVLVERQRGRADRWGGLAESQAGVHQGWRYALEFDSASTSAAEIAASIEAYVRSGLANT